MGVSGNSAEGSNYTAIGNSLNGLNPDIAMGSGDAAIGSEGTEGNFSTSRKKQDNFSPTEVDQSSEPTPEPAGDGVKIGESQKTAPTALSAYGSTSESGQDKGSENDDCLRTGLNGGEQLPSLAMATHEPTELIIKVGDRVVDVLSGFKGTVVEIEGDKVWFTTYELGKLWRHSNLVDVIG